jgi:hypothetical protein
MVVRTAATIREDMEVMDMVDMEEMTIMAITEMEATVLQAGTVRAVQVVMETILERDHLLRQKAKNCNWPVTSVVGGNSSESSALSIASAETDL